MTELVDLGDHSLVVCIIAYIVFCMQLTAFGTIGFGAQPMLVGGSAWMRRLSSGRKPKRYTQDNTMDYKHNRTSISHSLSLFLAAGVISISGLSTLAISGSDSSPDSHSSSSRSTHSSPSSAKSSSTSSSTSTTGSTRASRRAAANAANDKSNESHEVTSTESPTHSAKSSHSDESAQYNLGIEQSPVDIPAGMPAHDADIKFSYEPMALNIVNNGHTVQVNSDGDSFIEVEGKKYSLLQFHFHALSEHTLAGEHTPMEVHFVHQSADGEYAVVGVFLEQGENNAAYAPVFGNMPADSGKAQTVSGVAINTIDLLPAQREYYRYEGSFTTPPFTEGVKWFVMSNTVSLSSDEIGAYTQLYSDNYRMVQGINERTFIAGSSSCECCQARKVMASFQGDLVSE